MREMGITDENAARQALQVTNGDMQAALDLLFGGGSSWNKDLHFGGGFSWH